MHIVLQKFGPGKLYIYSMDPGHLDLESFVLMELHLELQKLKCIYDITPKKFVPLKFSNECSIFKGFMFRDIKVENAREAFSKL